MQEKKYALITGATGGLGQAFAFTLAKRGYNLIITGRTEKKLNDLSLRIKEKYAVETLGFALDLTDDLARNEFFDAVKKTGVKISLLACVAGVDTQKGFTQYTQEKITFQARVNFESAVSFCRFAIDNKAECLEIINVSSVSGIYPMPYFAIYSATKTALTSFSVSLREEMKGKGVSVTAVLPGAMPTREDIKEQIKGQGLWGKLAVKSPEWVAEYSLKAVGKNKRKVIPGFWNKCMRFFTAFIPMSLKLKFIAKRWSKISKDAF